MPQITFLVVGRADYIIMYTYILYSLLEYAITTSLVIHSVYLCFLRSLATILHHLRSNCGYISLFPTVATVRRWQLVLYSDCHSMITFSLYILMQTTVQSLYMSCSWHLLSVWLLYNPLYTTKLDDIQLGKNLHVRLDHVNHLILQCLLLIHVFLKLLVWANGLQILLTGINHRKIRQLRLRIELSYDQSINKCVDNLNIPGISCLHRLLFFNYIPSLQAWNGGYRVLFNIIIHWFQYTYIWISSDCMFFMYKQVSRHKHFPRMKLHTHTIIAYCSTDGLVGGSSTW